MTHLITRLTTAISRIGSSIGWKTRKTVDQNGVPGTSPDYKPEGYQGSSWENSGLADLGRQLEETQQEVSALQDTLSISSFERSDKKRRFKL